MSAFDDKLSRWRSATQQVKPSARLMAQLTALAVAEGAASAVGTAGATKAAATKTALWLSGLGLMGVTAAVVTGLLLLRNDRPPSDAESHSDRRGLPTLAIVTPQVPAAVQSPPAPQAMPELPGTPDQLAAAADELPMTCKAQRNVLIELIREHGHDDPKAAAAALARWTLLCRTVTGPRVDSHRWFWPWGLAPSGAGSACKTVMTDPDCEEGEDVLTSIAGAEECVRRTTPGSCARRAARLQAVFAGCELLIHAPGNERRIAVDRAVTGLTAEFGAALKQAAWCLEPEAAAEAQRVKRNLAHP